jgi:hypothetical protein
MQKITRLAIVALAVVSVVACQGNGTGTSPKPSTTDSNDPPKTDDGTNKPVDPALLSPNEKAFQEEYKKVLEKAATMTSDELASTYPVQGTPVEPNALGYDPLSAGYMAEITTAYTLTPAEEARLTKEGFMVSSRLEFPSMGDAYASVYSNDLPVLITTDAILHALHKSFDEILKQVEEQVLIEKLDGILEKTHSQLANVDALGDADLQSAVRDVDFFLTVARSLLGGQTVASLSGADTDAEVGIYLAAIAELRMEKREIFGSFRVMDFSQFKPRGHYEESEELKRYFQAMIWLGRIDFRFREFDPLTGQFIWHDRQIRGSYVIHEAVTKSGALPEWQSMSDLIGMMIGEPDAMDLAAYQTFVGDANLSSYGDVQGDLAGIRDILEKNRYGAQKINSHYLSTNPLSAEITPLPLSFTFMGQRFVVDSYTFASVVYDQVVNQGQKVPRALPVPLDAMFVLGANNALPLLQDELSTYQYQGNLHALRYLTDSYSESFWEQNMYNLWLGTLRTLNTSTFDAKYPTSMQTEAWSHKTLHTQLASWAQLRHDTILYVKQSYTGGISCEYPSGYVEPYPAFYARLKVFAEKSANILNNVEFKEAWMGDVIQNYFTEFAGTMTKLESIAQKELAQEPLSTEETEFITEWLKMDPGCGDAIFTGWYPRLFYGSEADEADPTIADVHTNPSDDPPLGPSRVLHVGTGNVNLMVFTRNSCEGSHAYVGPVLSYYEHVEMGVNRLNDSEWELMLKSDTPPQRPAWTKSFLVSP